MSNDFGAFNPATLTVITAPAHGAAVAQVGGTIRYTPTTGYSGTDTLTYRVADTFGTTTTAVVTYTVAPTAGNDSAITPVNVATTVDVLGNDAGSLSPGSVTVTGAPAHGTTSVNATTGRITYTPATDWSGNDSFTYRVSDGTTQVTAAVSVTVTPTAANDTASTNAGSAVTTSVLANDHGAFTPSTTTVTTAPAHGTTTVSATTGAVTYTPTAGWSGVDTYTYTVRDGANQPVSATVTVTVRPTAAPDTVTRSVTTAGPITLSPLTNDVGTLAASTFAFTGPAVITSYSWNATTGVLTLTQPGGSTASGTWTQGYQVCDAAGTCATSSITITVTPQAVADTASTPYTTAVGVAVLANDAGSLTPASVTVTGAPSHGSPSVNTSTGVVTYTPAAGWSGIDTFTYRASDGTTTSSATVTVTTTPTAANDTGTTTGTTPVTVDVLANDHGTLTPSSVTVTGAPSVGSTSVSSANGRITYTPPSGFSGSVPFTYRVSDGAGTNATATVTVRVYPRANNDAATTSVNTSTVVDVLANDDATPLISSEVVVGFAHGTATVDPSDGAVTYTPTNDWSGVDTATVAYQDTGLSPATTSTLTVTVVPSSSPDSASTPVGTAVGIPVLANDHGSLDPTTVLVPSSGAGSPAHGSVSVSSTTGVVTYTPAAGFSGTDTIVYSATDHVSPAVSNVVTVTVTPALTNDTATTDAASSVDVDVLANDHGSLDASTLSAGATSVHGDMLAVVGGKVRYTPLHTFSGTDTFTYSVSDTSAQTRSATVTVTVTPLATDDSASTTATTPSTTTDVLANDDGDLDPSTLVVTSGPAHATYALGPNPGEITVTAAAGWSGVTTLTYRVCDHAAQCTTARLEVTVLPVTGPVSATTPADIAVAIDPTDGQTGDLDPATTTVTTGPLHGSTTVDPSTGQITYTPDLHWSGEDAFTYTIEDHDGHLLTVTASVHVTPTATDDSATTTTGTSIDVSELTNDAGTFVTVGAPALAMSGGATAHGQVTVNPDLTLHYTPDPGFSGIDHISYVAYDQVGRTALAVVTVTVTPVAVDDSATSNAHAAVAVAVLANDAGSLDPGTVSVPASGPDAPAHGSVTIDPSNGTVTYTPDAAWSGTDTFRYTACDVDSGCASATVTVVTTPDAGDDSAATDVGTAVDVDVLADDHGTLDPASVVVTAAASHGATAVDLATGAITYTPQAGWSGTDTFGYEVTDDEGRVATATVTVDVGADAGDDVATTTAGTPTTVDVLANDHGALDPTTVQVNVAPAHGSTTVDPGTGDVTYTPAAGFSGDDVFIYHACDSAACVGATVHVHVDPTVADDTVSTPAGHTVITTVRANDHGSFDPSQTSVTSTPTHGTALVDHTDGTIAYTPAPGFSGDDVLVYEACDTTGTCASASLHVHVTPTAANDRGSSDVGDGAIVVDVLGNDIGAFGTGAVTIASGPGHGSATVDPATGRITYVPDSGWMGDDTVTYRVCDTTGSCTTARVAIAVKGLRIAAHPVCKRDAVSVDYTVTAFGFTPTAPAPVTILWEHGDGSVISTSYTNPLHGSALWPGTRLDRLGHAVDWPGWVTSADGTWHRTDDGLLPTLRIEAEAGPHASATVTYPRSTRSCAAAPRLGSGTGDSAAPDDKGSSAPSADSLAHTGSNLETTVQLAASLLLLGGIALVLTHRRRRTV